MAIIALRVLYFKERLDRLCPKPEVSLDWAPRPDRSLSDVAHREALA